MITKVASFTGAWIEIFVSSTDIPYNAVASFTGAWIVCSMESVTKYEGSDVH